MSRISVCFVAFALLAASCSPTSEDLLPAPQVFSASPQPLSTATPIPLLSTPEDSDPYSGLSIDELSARDYGGGELLALHTLHETDAYTRTLVRYPSDGLTINGFMDVPKGEGPFPVVIVLHGYLDPAVYTIETYTAHYAASFPEAGFLAIHPNYRNHIPSDFGPNLFRVGYAVDVLNLIAIVREQSGAPGALERADAENIFLWGHSMGGGIAQRVITVGAPVNGAVLYASMSGDERQNFEHIRDVLSVGDRGLEELAAPDDVFAAVSPANYYDRITVPMSIHHGNQDEVVPLAWSLDLCAQLEELGKEMECFTYSNMPHVFVGVNDNLLVRRSVDFFLRHLE